MRGWLLVAPRRSGEKLAGCSRGHGGSVMLCQPFDRGAWSALAAHATGLAGKGILEPRRACGSAAYLGKLYDRRLSARQSGYAAPSASTSWSQASRITDAQKSDLSAQRSGRLGEQFYTDAVRRHC